MATATIASTVQYKQENPYSVCTSSYQTSETHTKQQVANFGTSIYGLQRIDYSSEHRRLQSFEDWNFDDKPSSVELAKAGFYFTGEKDKAVCFKCLGGVYEWEKKDVPMEEHKKYYPNCDFVLHPDKYQQ